MKRKMKAGITSVMMPIFVRDTSSGTGAGLGSIVFNSSGLVGEYRRAGDSTWTAMTLATATLGTFTSAGWVADGALTGAYEIGLPDAAVAAGVRWAVVRYRGVANMLPVLIEIELDAVDYQDAVHFGLSSLPNAAAAASGGLPTIGVTIPNATAGAAGGLFIAGTNAATSITTGLTAHIIGTVDTITTYTGNTPQTGDNFARIGALGAGLTALAPAATALSNVQWTNARAVLLDNLDAAVTSRLAPTTAGRTLDVTATGEAGIDWANIGSPTSTVGLTNTTVGILTTYTGNTPQTGDNFARIGATGSGLTSLAPSATALSNVQWTNARAALIDHLDADVSTRLATSGYTVPPTSAANATAVWTDLLAGSDFSTASSIGKLLKDDIDAAVSSRSTYAGADTSGTTTLLSRLSSGRATLLDNLDAAISTRSTYAGADTSGTTTLLARLTATRAGNLDFLTAAPPTAAVIAGLVWDETLASHLTTGTTGFALNASGSAGDPWSTSLPGAYGAGTAGFLVGTNLDAAVSTRSTYAGGDTSGTTTLLSRLTSGRATNLDNLDAAVSTRSTYAGGAVALSSSGLDAVMIEIGLNARQALSIMAAESAGTVTGMDTGSPVFKGAGVATTRITATAASGNRTLVTLSPPA
jgi:hypothetical protein